MSVKAIDRRTVHRICSGQVVLSLAVAVKELVENSLDAGATVIEVRLKEHGSELVEICDNGSGVAEENLQALALKHHTSKITDFSDLEVGVATFGFRGEALSSLCALSNLTVTTCHMTAKVGTKLEYDSNGYIKTKTPCARQVGTTVSLRNLFHSLPVRRKEFVRNLKKEFVKMVQLLQGYCIVSTGVKITCHNQTGKGSKQLVLSTTGNSTLKDNITDVFGSKQFSQLIEVTQCTRDDLTSEDGEASSTSAEHTELFKLSGYVSRCNHGYGRGATDRQFFFFNNRPCDHLKLTKLVNEVYHMYNRHQYPFIVLNISTGKEHVDVNVTPDKRKVMLHQERALLLLIKVSLRKLFEAMQGLYDAKQVDHTPSPAYNANSSVSTPSTWPSTKSGSLKRFFSHESSSAPVPKQARLSDCGLTAAGTSYNVSFNEQESPLSLNKSIYRQTNNQEMSTLTTSENHMLECSGMDGASINDNPQTLSSCEELQARARSYPCAEGSSATEYVCFESSGISAISQTITNRQTPNVCTVSNSEIAKETVCTSLEGAQPSASSDCFISSNIDIPKIHSNIDGHSDCGDVRKSLLKVEINTEGVSCMKNGQRGQPDCDINDSDRASLVDRSCDDYVDVTMRPIGKGDSVATVNKANQLCEHVTFNLSAVARRLEVMAKEPGGPIREGGSKTFRAKISPTSNKDAENELRKEISKSDFSKMTVLGQFNLGFIITKLGSDLFIVDQHATDEKYNFERLQKETTIKHQSLLMPIPLELTAVHEGVVMDNLNVFEMNGFQFQIDHNAAPSKRIKLTSKPVCGRNWSLGPKDIDELVFMLSDGGVSLGEVVRPSSVRAYFASKACRTSVMIGTALSKSEMRKLINHMGEIAQPWNCPHGRPVMRHLLDLSRLQTN